MRLSAPSAPSAQPQRFLVRNDACQQERARAALRMGRLLQDQSSHRLVRSDLWACAIVALQQHEQVPEWPGQAQGRQAGV